MAEDNKNETLLQEIRDRWDYHRRAWQDVWEEGNKDMRYIAGDPWDDEERDARRKARRPCLVFDELQQHINQTVNEMRMNKLAIKVSPEGGGADQAAAELRQNRIRKIEYDSKAQTAYLRAYEDMISRSYGYFGLLTEFCDCETLEQRIKIRMFPNPNAVSLDPDAKEAAAADMMDAFVINSTPKEKFKRLYPEAEIKDFTTDHMAAAPQWVSDETVQIAEYWKVIVGKKKLYSIENLGVLSEDDLKAQKLKISGDRAIYIPDGTSLQLLGERKADTRQVKQYMTNGLEKLDETDWLGTWIPIFPMFGKELYVDAGGQTKRMLISRTRNARDPFMAYCYARSSEAELIRMTPKFPYIGYEGQFETQTDWEHMNDNVTAYAEVKAQTEGGGQAILPIPERQPYDPAIANLEMFAEACKRAIQSAFGSYNASVGKEDTHARSGVAIKSLQAQSSQGTYHFVDSDVTALEQAGRCMNELLDKIETGTRDVGIIKPDETHQMVRLNEQPADGSPVQSYGSGRFGVVVSAGPSFQTQREEASEFLDSMVQNWQSLPVDPATKAKFLSLAVKLKSLGPIGDEISTLLDPTAGQQQPIPPQIQAQMQQSQQLVMAMKQHIDQLEQEKQAKTLELESKESIVRLQEETKVLVAEITTKAQESALRMKMEQEQWALLHQSANDAASQAMDQQHEAGMQVGQQQHEADLAQQEQAAQAQQAQQEPQPAAQ